MTTHASPGPYDETRARSVYGYLGELTTHDLRFLTAQPSDEVRHRILNAWYGFHAARYAWDNVWRRHAKGEKTHA